MLYTVMMTETFEKEFSSHHRDRKDLLRKIIGKLEEEPQSGKPLRGKLHGLWQLKSGPFRIWYEINEREKTVTLRAVLHKDEARKFY